MTEQELQALREKGRKNLEEGARLATEEFMREFDRIAHDDTLPSLSPEEVEEAVKRIMDKYDQLKRGKSSEYEEQ